MTTVLLPEIQSAMGFSGDDFARVLGVDKSFLEKKTTIAQLRLDQLSRLAEELDCSVETFAKGFFDLKVIQKRYASRSQITLPARYRIAAFSKARTSVSLFQFIELNLGKALADRILKTLQVQPSLLEHHDQNVSMQLVMDIANLMSQWGVNPTLLEQMGAFSAYTNRTGPIGDFFKECRTPLEIYDKMIPILGEFFERNHEYRILALNHDECYIEAKTSQLIQDTLSVHRFGSVATCEVRKGVAGSFPLYINHEVKAVLHPLCMHRGDKRCVYHVIF
jgi:transcriptional regulator with XRE-family HTH domain